MHMTIGVLTYAGTKRSAIDNASQALNQLTEDNVAFDYFTVEDGHLLINAKGKRMKKGMRLVRMLHRWTRGALNKHLKNIARLVAMPHDSFLDKENQEITEDLHYSCNCFGQYRGHCIHLYDDDAEGIRTKEGLNARLNKWKCLWKSYPKYKHKWDGLGVWLVTADVHY